MSNIKEYPFQALQFYATAPYKCSYLQNIEARSQVATPPQLIDTEVYAKLIKNGFRRSGLFTYRPYCDHCKACIATRIKVKDFAPSRSQTRAWKKHQHLEARVLPLSFSEEHFTLYQQYQQSRHTPALINDNNQAISAHDEQDQYQQFLLKSNIESILVEFRENNILRMVSLIDVLNDALSSFYTFFDTSSSSSSYGTYGILWQINQAELLNLKYVYLGYYIEDSQKMSYKSQYRPLEGLIENKWTKIFD